MAKRVVYFITAVAIASLFSCMPPLPAENPGPATLKSALAGLPDIKMTLPKSLRVDNPTSKHVSRNLGDVTELTSISLNSMKSQAWLDLQSTTKNGMVELINKALGFLRTYANGHDVQFDQAFTIPVTDDDLVSLLGMPDSMRGMFTVTATFVIRGSSVDDFKLYAKITMNIKQSETVYATYTIPARLDITQQDGGTRIVLYMRATVAVTQNGTTTNQVMDMYGSVSSKTGELDMAARTPAYGGSGFSSSIMKTMVGGSGAITTVNRSQTDGYTPYVYVAYGDDTAGGIGSFSTYIYGGATHICYWGEYYGASGDLLLRANGDSVIWSPIGDESYYPNLSAIYASAAPETVYLRVSGTSYQVSTDNASWTTVPGFDTGTGVYGLIWRSGSTWQYGDVVYYGNETSWDNVDGTWVWVTKFTVGYRVPQPETHFGTSFYMSYEYPLKNLLPLSSTYAASYKLLQQEGDTNTWDWVDWNGMPQTSSCTAYTYYLNNNGGTTGFNASEGDIDLSSSLSSYKVYYYENGQTRSTLGYFYRTTGGLPPYFTAPDTAARSHVESQLQAALTSAYSASIDSYLDKFTVVDTDTAFTSF